MIIYMTSEMFYIYKNANKKLFTILQNMLSDNNHCSYNHHILNDVALCAYHVIFHVRQQNSNTSSIARIMIFLVHESHL